MRFIIGVAFCAALLAGEPLAADVVSAEAGGFKMVSKVTVDASRDDAWRAAVQDVDKWWDGDHTVSGEAGRLQIDAKPQGCFCETLGDDAGVVHMTVTMLYPPNVIRLTGGLGPLGLLGAEGNMTWEFDELDGNTQITFTYAVGGYRAGGLDVMARPVDAVITDALRRLQAYIETGNAEHSHVE